jgi:hypothetical protein
VWKEKLQRQHEKKNCGIARDKAVTMEPPTWRLHPDSFMIHTVAWYS